MISEKRKRIGGMAAALAAGILTAGAFCFLSGCSLAEKPTLRILSGSENQELEEILKECEEETGVNIEMVYKGSVDIMQELQRGAEGYDAVWPASSIWISMGDTHHLVKHAQSVSITPVVFGIRQSLAEELGFAGREDVSVKDILSAIEEGKLSFCMTSATQSNSGASAYIGFLYALLDKQEALTSEDLENEPLREQITELLSGIDRSSGSSDWLKDMFLNGSYDAMVNYECLMISANQELERQGREILQVIYPYDGLSIADSPLGYVDHKDAEKEDIFLEVQEYLMSDEVQNQIQRTGRRTGYEGVSDANQDVFRKDWGIDTERILSPIPMPDSQVLMEALNLYQTSYSEIARVSYGLLSGFFRKHAGRWKSAADGSHVPDSASGKRGAVFSSGRGKRSEYSHSLQRRCAERHGSDGFGR